MGTREQIINSAFECFQQYGYSKTTFLDIARKAGISRPLIYQYFKNKKDLFVTMTVERHDGYVIQTEEVLRSDLGKGEKLRKIIDIWLIEPYKLIKKSPNPDGWLNELTNFSHSENRYRDLFIKAISPLLGDDLAKVVVLGFKGLLDDRPSIPSLEKRVETLINALSLSSRS